MPKTIPVGIDLGTTVSAAAYLTAPAQSTMLRSAEGSILVPSVIYFSEDDVVVGDEAKSMAPICPEAIAQCVKRDFGEEYYHRPINGKRFPPEVLQSFILHKLKQDMMAEIGEGFGAVISVPAYFDEPRRRRTADAAEIADLRILGIVNEPTAAALAFGEHFGYLATRGVPREEMNLLVYDLGGGTFDVTVVHLEPNDVRTLAIEGDVRLGGQDWDERLVNRFAEEFIDKNGVDPRESEGMYVELNQLGQEVKHELSRRSTASMSARFARRSLKHTFTREEFEEISADLLERTRFSTKKVLQDAGLGFDALSRILLVGGSTRMPMVAEMLEELSGIKPDHVVNPDEAVARGAALYAGYILSTGVQSNGYQVTDVNPHRLGVEGVDPESGRRRAAGVIPKNTELPACRTRRFVTRDAGQQSVVIKVLEGDSDFPDECTVVGKTVLEDLPPHLEAEHPIDVQFSYDKDGRLSVTAKLPSSECQVAIEFQRENGLSPAGINHWRNVVCRNGGTNTSSHVIE